MDDEPDEETKQKLLREYDDSWMMAECYFTTRYNADRCFSDDVKNYNGKSSPVKDERCKGDEARKEGGNQKTKKETP